MKPVRKSDLDRRLDAYFAALRSSPLREALKRSVANWQVYAAVTGSAMAMVTGASASTLGTSVRDIAAEPIAIASALAARQRASSRNIPLVRSVKLAMARQDARRGFLQSAVAQVRSASQAQAPTISPHGIVPLYSTVDIIQPGEWVSIFGSNLAGGTATWNGDFPTILGGTSVTINGRAAFLQFVSPGQINLQAPDDTAMGTVSVVVTTAAGSATSTVTLSQFSPSFDLRAANYASGIIRRGKGKGAYGGGTYDILGPTGSSLGYPTVAAHAGDHVELYAGGFGPTNPVVPAGKAFSGAAPIRNPLSLYINNILIKPSFVGLSSAGVYQINFEVPPDLGQGDVPIKAIVGGTQTQMGVLFPLLNGSGGPQVFLNTGGSNGTSFNNFGGGGTYGGTYGGTNGGGGGGTNGGGGMNGGGGGTNGGGGGSDGGGGDSGGGSGGGSARATPHGKKPYEPKLLFEKA
jgi:uncharacterized protein (TIGR03437 family)